MIRTRSIIALLGTEISGRIKRRPTTPEAAAPTDTASAKPEPAPPEPDKARRDIVE